MILSSLFFNETSYTKRKDAHLETEHITSTIIIRLSLSPNIVSLSADKRNV